MDTIKEFLKELGMALIYLIKDIFKNVLYLLIIIVLGIIILYARNPYGRYLDAWLE